MAASLRAATAPPAGLIMQTAVTMLSDAGERFGRHFSQVNLLTSSIVVAVPLAFIGAGAPASAPNWADLTTTADRIGLVGAALGLVGIYVLGVALAPLQFATTQVLEGYWGNWGLTRRAMARSTLRALARSQRADQQLSDAQTAIEQADALLVRIAKVLEPLPQGERRAEVYRLYTKVLVRRVPHLANYQQASRAGAKFPANQRDLMPTALGNVLRRHERLAGEPFGLDAVAVMPAVVTLAGGRELLHHDDARSTLDLAVRMVYVWAAVAMVTTVLLWRFGPWMAVPATCSLLSLMSYRGAVSAASQYGSAMSVSIALNRPALYQRLGLPQPTSREDEVKLGRIISQMLNPSYQFDDHPLEMTPPT